MVSNHTLNGFKTVILNLTEGNIASLGIFRVNCSLYGVSTLNERLLVQSEDHLFFFLCKLNIVVFKL